MFQVPSLILHCDKTLKFPKSKTIDEATVDLIRGLLRDETIRLGKNGIHEIVTHRFFSSINWQSMGIINTNLLYVCFIISRTAQLVARIRVSIALFRWTVFQWGTIDATEKRNTDTDSSPRCGKGFPELTYITNSPTGVPAVRVCSRIYW